MARPKKASKTSKKIFMNVPISPATRDGLHLLKDAMGVSSQAEVIEKLVAIGVAISQASK